ncbi:hypothetical protein QTJ16_007085 [Diplocarpon rosae]|uniref:Uncharacterized protein n=1 Tax=Diplocarpon rosae TaxID=946125 RepID=A0AAD9STY7_9HELO|nr:hypothetical protein QTJ16_007085 [Diplocarpon rosae]PBP21162.1 hypothetical protein BUE80_DR007980 [Diplocarpon rosae]
MQFNLVLATMVFQFASALTIPALSISAELIGGDSPAGTTPTPERSLHRRATYDVLCRAGVFQNPDMDIAEVVCIAEARCQGGQDAVEVQDANGETMFQTACYGCPVITSVGGMTNGCMFKDVVHAKC